jgi:hypothetical protein
MKKVIYSDLSRNSDDQLGELKTVLSKFPENKMLCGFLLQELTIRRDNILYDDSMEPLEKIGAIKQVTEITELIVGNGILTINRIMQNRQPKVPQSPEEFEKFKEKVLK